VLKTQAKSMNLIASHDIPSITGLGASWDLTLNLMGSDHHLIHLFPRLGKEPGDFPQRA